MTSSINRNKPTAVLGAGLSGLTVAYVLHKNGFPVQVFEAEKFIGGASRTVMHDGFRFDLGPHHLHTQNHDVLDLVGKLLGDELLTVTRLSSIYMEGKFVTYPLSFFDALFALGPATSLAAASSYGVECVRRTFSSSPENSFEEWVVSQFGRKLYEIYFRPYSEKVWGVSCSRLNANFAVHRIKPLSFREAIKNTLWRIVNPQVKLASQFPHPRLGFGRIPERLAEELSPDSVKLQCSVTRVEHDGRRVIGLTYLNGGELSHCKPAHVISTIPISSLVRSLSPAPSADVLDAAAGLKYRDIVFVFLALDHEQVTPYNWIYFSSDDVFFGRIHEPKNFSPAMSPPGTTSLVVEIYCYESDPIWTEPAELLINRVSRRIAELGLIEEEQVTGGCVVHLRKAYPIYVDDYEQRLATILDFLRPMKNLQVVGRNGLFKYISGGDCIEISIRAVENLRGHNHNLRSLASEKKYAES
jgi:protoporphyrinogen oxidase